MTSLFVSLQKKHPKPLPFIHLDIYKNALSLPLKSPTPQDPTRPNTNPRPETTKLGAQNRSPTPRVNPTLEYENPGRYNSPLLKENFVLEIYLSGRDEDTELSCPSPLPTLLLLFRGSSTKPLPKVCTCSEAP